MPLISQPLSLSRQISPTLSRLKNLDQQILSLLPSCKSLKHFKQIYAHVLRTGEFANTFLATKLLEFWVVSAKEMDYALRIFYTINQPDAYTWTTMIRGFLQIKMPEKAVQFHVRMRSFGVEPNRFTFLFMLKAYSLIPIYSEGRALHGKIMKAGFEIDTFIHTALIHLYFKFGDIEAANRLFCDCSHNNVVTWNTMISGSFGCGEIEFGRKLFDEMPERTVASWNAAISGYAKWGHLDRARALFDAMPEKDLFSWSAMISSYTQSNMVKQAIALFQEMFSVGVRPDGATLVSALSACSQIGALDMGKWIHAYINRNKVRHDVILGTALVDMYAKCGCLDVALQVFHSMPHRNVSSWNAMLCGLALHGHGHEALELFARMELNQVRPNAITFVGVLSACSHIGLVEEGRRQFERMCKDFKIIPKIEHYGCMVDILGRAGLVDEAKELVRSMPMEPNHVVLGALLGACRIHGDIDAGEDAVKHLLKLAPKDGGCHVILSNIYAAKNCWDEVAKMRNLMTELGLEKVPGCSSIEVNSVIHEFLVEDKTHSNWEEISEALCRLSNHLEDEGYVSNFL